MCMIWLQVDDLEAARQKALKRWNQPACEFSATVSKLMLHFLTIVLWTHMTCICKNLCIICTVPAIAPELYNFAGKSAS